MQILVSMYASSPVVFSVYQGVALPFVAKKTRLTTI